MPNKHCIILVLAVVLVARLSTAADVEQRKGVESAKRFWAALAKADTKTMQEFYAPKVVLKKGSELLKKQWGLKGGGERDKDLSLEREELIAGYQRMMQKIGKERWSKLFGEIDAEKINFTFAKQSDRRTGVRKGDLTMKVSTGPGDDALSFFLRRDDKGRWLVVAEATDY